MSEETITQNEKKSVYPGLFVGCLLLVVLFMGGVIITKSSNYKDDLNIAGTELERLVHENIQLKTKYNKIVVEFDKLKSDLQNIKDKDDLMKRDIKLYIKSRYRSVPNVVAHTIAESAVKLGKKYEVSIPLLVGIMQVESITFNPMALSKKGAIGLMQVMPEWVPKLGLKNKFELYNIDTNIESGIRVLKIHIGEAKGSITKGLYLYVNKDRTYADKVYTAVGKFVTYRSTVDNEKVNNDNGTIKKDQEQSEKGEVVNNERNPK
jgi:soluble lytic murein transglycosylase-like protein